MKPDGSILPCAPCNLAPGSLQETTFHEIGNHAASVDFRRKTRTGEGLRSMCNACDGSYSCNLGNNLNADRYFRFLAPLIRVAQSAGGL